MTSPTFERTVRRLVERSNRAFGEDVARLREDAGITRLQLATAAGLSDSYLAKVEAGTTQPSSETGIRLGLALGADFSRRLYPTTGPTIRDRHQAPIAEGLLTVIHPRWRRFLEVGVRRPSRGWIDVGLHSPADHVFIAGEIQSELHRLEQLVRWSDAKAESVPSWDGFAQLGEAPVISKLLLARETRSNRTIAREFRRVLRTAYPADPVDALASLCGTEPWPGAAMLWAVRDPDAPAGYRIVARQ
jgi:transcriptional regulator with XRE-family HTH domain